MLRNRHLAEWRFRPLMRIVMVNPCRFRPLDKSKEFGIIKITKAPSARTVWPLVMLASVDKDTHARRTHRPAFRGVIVLDRRQPACVLCLAKNAPERPAGLRVFPEHGRQMTRQTRQMGRRPSTRITQPAAVQARKNHVCPCQLTLGSRNNHETVTCQSGGFGHLCGW